MREKFSPAVAAVVVVGVLALMGLVVTFWIKPSSREDVAPDPPLSSGAAPVPSPSTSTPTAPVPEVAEENTDPSAAPEEPALSDADRASAQAAAQGYLAAAANAVGASQTSTSSYLDALAPYATPGLIAHLRESGPPDGFGMYASAHEAGLNLRAKDVGCSPDTDDPSSFSVTVDCTYVVATVDASGAEVTPTVSPWSYDGVTASSALMTIARQQDGSWRVAEVFG